MNEVNESAEKAPEENVEKPASTPTKRGGSLWVVVVAVLVALGLAIAYQQGMFSGSSTTEEEGSDAMVENADEVVATVNGTEITRGELVEKAEQIRKSIPEGYSDPSTDPNFERDVLDEIINVQLLVARAEDNGYAVTDEEIETEIQGLIEVFGDEEAFAAQLEIAGLSQDELRENMENELLIRRLIDNETNIADIEVTEEELTAAYDLAIADAGEEAPTLDQVRDLLQAELLNQKSAALINAYILDVREEAEVEVAL